MKYAKGLKIFISAQIALILLVLALYRCVGERFIKMMYDGVSLPFLNSVIQGQAKTPPLFYIFKADELFLKCFLLAAIFIVFEIVVFVITGKLELASALTSEISRPRSDKRQRNNRFRITLIAGILILVASLYLLRYERILRRLRDYTVVTAPSFKEKRFPKLEMEQAVMLGNAHTESRHPKSSYLEYPKYKKPGAIRIGIFGCSFVEGTEAAGGHDIASFLQDKFNKAGIKNAEVINFGVCGYGVHQMYLLWEYVGKDYDLDYVVFVPFSWHEERDRTFMFNKDSYGPIHARFILKDSGLELIPALGQTRPQACKIYYGIISPWRYVRYENKMPIFLKTLLPSFLHERSNPFYHKIGRSKKEEISLTYKALFEKIAENAKNLIIVTSDDKIYSLRKDIRLHNVYFLKSRASQTVNFLYLAKGHNSALGNQLLANEIFFLLTGQDRSHLEIIGLSYPPVGKTEDFSLSALPIYEYADISLNIGGYPVASFLSKENLSRSIDFRKNKITSLLLMPSAACTRFPVFLPSPFLLNANERLFLSFRTPKGPVKVPIGTMDAPSGVVGKWLPGCDEDDYFVKNGKDWLLEMKGGNLFLCANPGIEDIRITAGSKELLKAAPFYGNPLFNFLNKAVLGRTSVSFKPAISDFACLRATAGDFIDIDSFNKKEGTLDLVLSGKSGREKRYPIFSYRIAPAETSLYDPVYPNPAVLPDVGGRINQND